MAVWDWRTGQKLRQVPGDLPLAFSPDGRFIGRENGVYNAVTGRRVCQISTRESIAEDGQCAFTPDGKWYGIIGSTTNDFNARNVDDGGKLFYSTTLLHFWRTDTGQEAKDYPFTRVRAFDIARDGHWLVMASDTGNPGGSDGSIVRCVDISTGKVLWTRERSMNRPDADSESVINSLAISPSGKYAVLLSIDSHLIVLDAGTGRELFRPLVFPSLNPPDWAIPGGLAFSADGQTLVSRCGRRVLVWDASSLQ